MTARVFVDATILIYAHDIEAGERHRKAATLVRELWQNANGAISVQVLQAFYVNVTRKVPQPLPRPLARGLIEVYAAWEVVVPGADDLDRGPLFWPGHRGDPGRQSAAVTLFPSFRPSPGCHRPLDCMPRWSAALPGRAAGWAPPGFSRPR